MNNLSKLIGDPVSRVEARLKVTGAARFSADIPMENALVAYPVLSTIGSGTIRFIDVETALKVKGVVTVLTYTNAPRLSAPTGPGVLPYNLLFTLQDNVVNNFGQYIALVIAETFEQARYAASLITVHYNQGQGVYSFHDNVDNATSDPHVLTRDLRTHILRGSPDEGRGLGSVHVQESYTIPYEHHYAMEPHVAMANWTASDSFVVYSSTQQVITEQQTLAALFNVPAANVQVIAKFIGGGFGAKTYTWGHILLAVMAARYTARPVKLVVPRKHLASTVGYRPYIDNRIELSATPQGTLTFIGHHVISATDVRRLYIERAGEVTPHLYTSPHLEVLHTGVNLNMPYATIMRAPGATPGLFALESAMDELANKLQLDAVQLREINEPANDPSTGLPWSSRNLVACMHDGASAFNWFSRNKNIRDQKRGKKLYGQGMANATYPAGRQPSRAQVIFGFNNQVTVRLAATDLGTGTYTILTQVASELLGIPMNQITVEIGDSALPMAPGSGSSIGASSWSNAVLAACRNLLQEFIRLLDSSSPLYGIPIEDLVCRNGSIQHKDDESRSQGFIDILAQYNNSNNLSAMGLTTPPPATHAYYSYGSHFAEVSVDVDTGEVRVERWVARFACGRILNLKTARSQIEGSIIWGIGMALMEESFIDTRLGKFVNNDFGGYHVPVIADIPEMDIGFIEEYDEAINETGVKGLGEVALAGVAAAIANAVYHATGRRIRNLPITPDKLLGV